MDHLHSGRLDGFCLASADSDTTRLAARIREQDVDVFGFGEQNTPESLRRVFRRFTCTENRLPDARADVEATGGRAKPLQPPNAATPIILRDMCANARVPGLRGNLESPNCRQATRFRLAIVR